MCLHWGGFGGQCRHIWQSHGVPTTFAPWASSPNQLRRTQRRVPRLDHVDLREALEPGALPVVSVLEGMDVVPSGRDLMREVNKNGRVLGCFRVSKTECWCCWLCLNVFGFSFLVGVL